MCGDHRNGVVLLRICALLSFSKVTCEKKNCGRSQTMKQIIFISTSSLSPPRPQVGCRPSLRPFLLQVWKTHQNLHGRDILAIIITDGELYKKNRDIWRKKSRTFIQRIWHRIIVEVVSGGRGDEQQHQTNTRQTNVSKLYQTNMRCKNIHVEPLLPNPLPPASQFHIYNTYLH